MLAVLAVMFIVSLATAVLVVLLTRFPFRAVVPPVAAFFFFWIATSGAIMWSWFTELQDSPLRKAMPGLFLIFVPLLPPLIGIGVGLGVVKLLDVKVPDWRTSRGETS